MLRKNVINSMVVRAVKEVLSEADVPQPAEIKSTHNFVSDLSFSSLMIAQLIMVIQESTDKEPFTENVAISDIVTVKDMIDAYSEDETH